VLLGVSILLSSCTTTQIAVSTVVGTVVATVMGGYAPTQEIEQIYYLGVFDPQEQVPPTVYRVRVRGQASFISQMKFASGWVQADVIDSLGTSIEHDSETGRISIQRVGSDPLASISTGRRLMMFGPEGFREAPANHRLVLVMGSSPEKYFEAVDTVLGTVSQAFAKQRQSGLTAELMTALTTTSRERADLAELRTRLESELPRQGEAGS
jgi:hypothetical protein